MVRETASQQQLNMWIPVQSATDDDGYNYYNRAVNQEKEKVTKVENGAMHPLLVLLASRSIIHRPTPMLCMHAKYAMEPEPSPQKLA